MSLRFWILAIGTICTNGEKNVAYGNPLASKVMDQMAPMVHPIAIGANDNHHWHQWWSPLVVNGAISMAPLAPFRGNVKVKISNESWWHQWRPMATVATLAPMVTMTIHWRQWWYIGHRMVLVAILTIAPMAILVSIAIVSMVKIVPLATLAPVASLAPMAPLNGKVSPTFHMPNCTLTSMTPLESLVPLASLTPMPSMMPMNHYLHQWIADASMMPMNRHLHQLIANVVNGAINTIGVNDANGTNKSPFAPIDRLCFHWRQWRHWQLLAIVEYTKPRNGAMETFCLIHRSPMVIVIGANGDRHWRQWRQGAPLAPLGPLPNWR